MIEIFKDVEDLTSGEVINIIKNTDKLKKQIKGDDSAVLKEFKTYLKLVKKKAFEMEICPVCGEELAWHFIVNKKTTEVVGCLKCKSCGYIGVIK